jgi:hypothetical protein
MPVRPLYFLVVVLITSSLMVLADPISSSAGEQKGEKKLAKHEKIKQLEATIRELREEERFTIKMIDDRFNFAINYLEPEKVKGRLEEMVRTLRHVHEEVLREGDVDFAGHRKVAQEAVKTAKNQLEKTIKHNTADEREKAAHNLKVAHLEIGKALKYSLENFGSEKAKPETEARKVANGELREAKWQIEFTEHLLKVVHYEIKDFPAERKKLEARRESEKKSTREQYGATIGKLEAELRALKK